MITTLTVGCSFPKKRCSFYRGGYCASNNESYKCLTERLGTAGVAIKVDREEGDMPTPSGKPKGDAYFSVLRFAEGYNQRKVDMINAGYVAVEPLVKE